MKGGTKWWDKMAFPGTERRLDGTERLGQKARPQQLYVVELGKRMEYSGVSSAAGCHDGIGSNLELLDDRVTWSGVAL